MLKSVNSLNGYLVLNGYGYLSTILEDELTKKSKSGEMYPYTRRLKMRNLTLKTENRLYNGGVLKPTSKDIKKKGSDECEIFDKYCVNLSKEYREELKNKTEKMINEVMRKYDINKLNIIIDIDDEISLTKDEVELINEEKVIYYPTVNLSYESEKTNREIIIIKSAEVKISFDGEMICPSYIEWLMSYFN